MAWTRAFLLLALAFAVANAAGDTFCGKRTKKTVTIEQGDKVVFKTQREKAKKYRPNTNCIATYELGSTCSEMKLSCSTSRIGNKDKKKCLKGDKITVIGEKKIEKFCGTRKPRKMIRRGLMKVKFSSDNKNNAPGATCFVKCSSKKETNPPQEETAAPEDVLLLVGGQDDGGNTLKSSEVYGHPSCPVPEFPFATHLDNVIYFNNQVLACGGYSAKDKCYSLGRSEWSEHSNLTYSRYYSSAVVVGESLYLLGGVGALDSYEVLSAGSSVWASYQNIPGKVRASCAVALDDGFVIIGSYEYDNRAQVIQYNGSSWDIANWEPLPEGGRYAHSCLMFNTNIIVAGGYRNENLATTVIINTMTKANTDGPDLTGPRKRFVFASVNGLLLAVGGAYDGVATKNSEIFDPTEGGGGTLHQNLSTTRYYLMDGAVVPKSALFNIIGCS